MSVHIRGSLLTLNLTIEYVLSLTSRSPGEVVCLGICRTTRGLWVRSHQPAEHESNRHRPKVLPF